MRRIPAAIPLSARASWWVAAIALLSLAPPVRGQIVAGAVTDSGTGAPIRGAVVALMSDSGGASVRRALTGEDGSFAIRAPAPGRYAIQVRAIGYRPSTSAVFALGDGETLTRRPALAAVVTKLSGIRVQANSPCRRSADFDAVTIEVWDDVWAALASSEIAHEQNLLQADVYVYSREFDAESGTILREAHRTVSVLDELPFRTASPADLQQFGYWRQTVGGEINLYAPDATVITSPEFLGAHCFGLMRADSTPGSDVGLTFRPLNGEQSNDVEGVLWIDPGTRELRDLEFTYTGLPATRGRRAEGRIYFTRMPNDAWADYRWVIQQPFEMPKVPAAQETNGARPPAPGLAVREGGGFILTATSRQAYFVSAVGRVRDAGGSPATGAMVEAVGTGQRVLVDADGAWRLDELVPGAYEVRVLRAGSAEAGGFVQRAVVQFEPGSPLRIDVRIPRDSTIARELCPTLPADGATFPLYGVLRDVHSGRPMPNYGMEVGWSLPADPTSPTRTMRRAGGAKLLSDWRGEVITCDVPAGADIRFRAAAAGEDEWSDPVPAGNHLFVIEIAVDTAARRDTSTALSIRERLTPPSVARSVGEGVPAASAAMSFRGGLAGARPTRNLRAIRAKRGMARGSLGRSAPSG